jgi:hypothetical protein
MNIVIVIIQSVALLLQIIGLFYLLRLYKKTSNFQKVYTEDNPQRVIRKIESNQLMNDVVEYALNSGLECMVMPGDEDNSALFARNRISNDMISVCIIVNTNFEKDSKEYNLILNNLKEEINNFIKNNPEFIEEKRNVKN